MKILFLHGWRSVPGGVKPTSLISHGHHVLNPKLDDDNFDRALQVAQQVYDLEKPDVIVGSSRGGSVAMNIRSQHSQTDTPLVLLCPAWKRWGTVRTLKRNSLILHSRQDDVIPFGDSVELIVSSRLPAETLIETGRDHRLADEDSLSVLAWACRLLASGRSLTTLHDNDDNDENRDPSELSGYDARMTTQEDASYVCDACGEEIVIPLDLTEGAT